MAGLGVAEWSSPWNAQPATTKKVVRTDWRCTKCQDIQFGGAACRLCGEPRPVFFRAGAADEEEDRFGKAPSNPAAAVILPAWLSDGLNQLWQRSDPSASFGQLQHNIAPTPSDVMATTENKRTKEHRRRPSSCSSVASSDAGSVTSSVASSVGRPRKASSQGSARPRRKSGGRKGKKSRKKPAFQWPPEDGYGEECNGWQKNSISPHWLYKPESGTYFHIPTDMLWRRVRRGIGGFVRVADDVSGVLFGDSAVGQQVRLKACLLAWRRQLSKFEDMDHELQERCHEPRTKGMPRTSDPRAADRGDDSILDIIRPLSSRMHRQISGMFDDVASRAASLGAGRRPRSASSSSESSLAEEAVTDEIKKMRRIASRGNLSSRSHLSTRSQSQPPLSARSNFSTMSRPEIRRSASVSGKDPPLSARSQLSAWRYSER